MEPHTMIQVKAFFFSFFVVATPDDDKTGLEIRHSIHSRNKLTLKTSESWEIISAELDINSKSPPLPHQPKPSHDHPIDKRLNSVNKTRLQNTIT